jgi:diadenylate cyclase
VSLDPYAESGSTLDAKVTADLLSTIFTPYSPLHDGAAIIRGDSIIAAGCILPLSQTAIADRAVGTRHRAALGLSDETDALVLVVSEERATVSIAERGRLWRDLSPLEVRGVLAGRPPAREAVSATGVTT